MNTKRIALSLCFLHLFSCGFQTNKDETNSSDIHFSLIFADGFNSNEIVLKINEDEIIKSVLSSDASTGSTSLWYDIIINSGKVQLTEGNEKERILLNSNQDCLELTVTLEDNTYIFRPVEENGQYILVELIDNRIVFSQQRRKPIFE